MSGNGGNICYLGYPITLTWVLTLHVMGPGTYVHIQKIRDNCKKRVNQLHSVISNRDINLSARRLLLLSVVRPSLEYGSEIWDCNKSQTRALESIILGGAKKILGCSSKTCNEAVWGDMGLETFKSRRDRAKLKWWYKVCRLPDNRYPKQLLRNTWLE